MLWSIPTIHIRWLNPRHRQAMLWMNCCDYMYVRYLKYFSCHHYGVLQLYFKSGYLLFCRRQHFSSLDDERCNNLFVKFNSCKLQQLQRLSKWCQISVRSLRTSICYIMPYNMHVISRDRILGECFFCSLCSYRPNLIYEHELEGKKGFCSAYKWLF